MNKIILLGRLTKKPEFRVGQNDIRIVKFTLAVQRKYAKSGEERQTDFFNVVAFGNLANFVLNYFSKGQQMLLSGRTEINQYQDESGINKTNIQVVAEEIFFADSKKENNEERETYEDLYENLVVDNDNDDDDLPF